MWPLHTEYSVYPKFAADPDMTSLTENTAFLPKEAIQAQWSFLYKLEMIVRADRNIGYFNCPNVSSQVLRNDSFWVEST